MEKITYVSVLNTLIESENLPLSAVEVEKLTALRDSLVRKSSAERKPTKGQIANASIADAVYAFMAENPDTLYQVSELMKSVPELDGLSNQKCSAIVRTLKDTGRVERIEDKRKAYFKVVLA